MTILPAVDAGLPAVDAGLFAVDAGLFVVDPTILVAGIPQLVVETDLLIEEGLRILGLALLAATIGGAAGFLYRWYGKSRIPEGIAVLFGLAAVALILNTRVALGDAIGGTTEFLTPSAAVFTVGTFFAGGIAADLGGRIGDRAAVDVGAIAGTPPTEVDIARFIRSAGRITAIRLPDELDDLEGYDPVPSETKARISGATMAFPRGLGPDELRDRLTSRLTTDYGVQNVEIRVTDEGGIDSLAIGRRPAGIGPTLASGTRAVAIHADPPAAASAGDVVEIRPDDEPTATIDRKTITAEIRTVRNDAVTVVIDATDAELLDPDRRYRLVTLPDHPRRDREAISRLRTTDAVSAAVFVEPNSRLDGVTVGEFDALVVAVERTDGEVDATPSAERVLSAGETIYTIGEQSLIQSLIGQGSERTARTDR